MNDRQTHVIPREGDLLKSLSKYLQFYRPDAFFTKLQDYRTKVRKIYESIIGVDTSDFKREQNFSTFKDINRAKKNILFLKEGKGLVEIKEFDSRTTSLFIEIEDALIEQFVMCKFPDTALANLAKIVQRSAFPSYWYEAFKDEFMLNTIVRFCECSQISVDLLTEDHSLKDIVMSGKLFEEIDPEADNTLSVKALLFIISSQFVLGFIDEEEAAKALALTLRQKVRSIISSFQISDGTKYFIAAAGSFSLGEMHLYSDTDLIIVCDDINKYPEAESEFVALLGKLREELAPLGSDCRLRPEGKSGQLVWDIEAYKSYFEKRIQIWELQSLTKISFLYGDSTLYDEFTGLIQQKVSTLDSLSLKKEIFEMRKRLYPASFSGLNALSDLVKGRGGVTDVEFINQYLLLLNPEYLKLCMGKGNRQTLEYFRNKERENESLLDEDGYAVQSERYGEFNKLLEGFEFLRSVRLSIQCVYHINSNLFPSKQKGEILYKFLNYESYDELAKAVQSSLKQNNEIFHQILKG
ncbi:MAG: hypothetical protein IPJ75_05030 [Ignavibacteriales bacterium]|nr:hypothetical protein [Ignavibacteriales bacterium]